MDFTKDISVLRVTFKEYLAYRLNFVLWRFRTLIQLLVLYFFWQAAIPEGTVLFGYDQAKILTYILGTAIVRSFVLSSRSADVAGQIASGDLVNYLLKPLDYFRYWLAKDLADKVLNLVFSIFEIILLILILKPPLIWQTDPLLLLFTSISIFLAIVLYFYISFLLSLIAFWTPENPWPIRFIFMIITEFLSGGIFPLNILSPLLYSFLTVLPFSYLIFFPLNIYLGNLSIAGAISGMAIAFFWIIVFSYLATTLFKKGLKNYAAWGK